MIGILEQRDINPFPNLKTKELNQLPFSLRYSTPQVQPLLEKEKVKGDLLLAIPSVIALNISMYYQYYQTWTDNQLDN